mmetsp:Transcript_90618/g.189505  ORF Transcript_90618/g.189505 Transcript_90618/m.189505 type:complete len:88 (-) Transcript_90618:33-296(-)
MTTLVFPLFLPYQISFSLHLPGRAAEPAILAIPIGACLTGRQAVATDAAAAAAAEAAATSAVLFAEPGVLPTDTERPAAERCFHHDW